MKPSKSWRGKAWAYPVYVRLGLPINLFESQFLPGLRQYNVTIRPVRPVRRKAVTPIKAKKGKR